MRPKKQLTRRDVLRVMGLGAASALVPAGVADFSSNHLVLEKHELRLPRWDADGFRVAIVSDFHANDEAKAERAAESIRLALAQEPDLLAMPGDFLDSSDSKRIGFLSSALEPLRDAKCPVVSTLGNHDYWTNAPRKIVELMSERTKLLRNDTFEVSGVTVAGVDDAIANRHRFDFLEERKHSKSLLALFHEPDYVREMPGHVSLQLSGHSHGGQICLPNGRSVHTPKGAREFIKGFYPEAPVPIYVTRGVGTTGLDWRLFCMPEVTVLTLRGT